MCDILFLTLRLVPRLALVPQPDILCWLSQRQRQKGRKSFDCQFGRWWQQSYHREELRRDEVERKRFTSSSLFFPGKVGYLKDEAGKVLYFLYCKRITNNELIPPTSVVCAAKTFSVQEICCCPKTEHASASHTAALGDIFLHYHEHWHYSLSNWLVNPMLKIVPVKAK